MGNTVVRDWQIVSVIGDNNELFGQVLWAIVIDDSTLRFSKNDYVCTSSIKSINTYTKLVKTVSGSIYQLVGEGSTAEVQFKFHELLRMGHSPQEINVLTRTAH